MYGGDGKVVCWREFWTFYLSVVVLPTPNGGGTLSRGGDDQHFQIEFEREGQCYSNTRFSQPSLVCNLYGISTVFDIDAVDLVLIAMDYPKH